MKSAVLATLLAALGATAIPTSYPYSNRALKRASGTPSGPTDVQILQYALTLENLEKKFYADALANFTESDFADAGFPDWVRGRIAQIGAHEADHVTFISGALGNDSVAPCTYSFPYTDPKSFVSLASLIENVGVSAYAGAAQYITSPEYLEAAAVILSVEARHQAWESSAGLMVNPWSSAFDTPLGLDMVYTIASAFITGCPSSNPALPVMAFPSLAVGTDAAAGMSTSFTFNDPHNATNYAVFYNGLGSTAVQLDQNDMATVPMGLMGISYVLISTASDPTKVANDNIVAGPAILDFPFNAWASDSPPYGM